MRAIHLPIDEAGAQTMNPACSPSLPTELLLLIPADVGNLNGPLHLFMRFVLSCFVHAHQLMLHGTYRSRGSDPTNQFINVL